MTALNFPNSPTLGETYSKYKWDGEKWVPGHTVLPAWTPAQLTTVRLWFKGDTLAGSDGSNISTWPDASGYGNNATTGAFFPTLKLADQNGLNTVRFVAGSFHKLELPNVFTGFTEGAVALVLKLVSDPGGGTASDHGPFHLGADGSVQNHYAFYANGEIYDDFGSTARKSVGNPSATLTVYHLLGFRSKASDWRCFINGTQIFSTATNTVGWRTTPVFAHTPAGSSSFNGWMGEIVILNEFASTSDWQKLEGYLAWKWGIVSTLDAGHPYKSAAP